MQIIKGHRVAVFNLSNPGYLSQFLLQQMSLSTALRSSIIPRQVSYQDLPSEADTKQNTAEHLSNYFCSCSSELLLGARPAALQVTVSAHSEKKRLGWLESPEDQSTKTHPEQVWDMTQHHECALFFIIIHNKQQI